MFLSQGFFFGGGDYWNLNEYKMFCTRRDNCCIFSPLNLWCLMTCKAFYVLIRRDISPYSTADPYIEYKVNIGHRLQRGEPILREDSLPYPNNSQSLQSSYSVCFNTVVFQLWRKGVLVFSNAMSITYV